MPPHAEPGPRPAAQATLREFLDVLFRRKWIVLGLFLVTTLTVALVALSQRTEFVSSGRVMVKRGEQESMLTPTRRIIGAWEEDLGSEVQLVRSYPVLQLAREILRKQTAPGAKVPALDGKNVDAEVIGKSNVLAIAYVDADPERAQQTCDALLKAYIEFRQKDLSLAYPREFFDAEILKVEKELARLNEMRREYSNRENVYDITEQQRSLINQIGGLENRRSEVEADLAEARSAQQQMAELKANPHIDLPTFSQLYSNENALLQTKTKVLDQEARVAKLRERLTDDAPPVAQALVTLQTLRDMLGREVDSRLMMSQSHIETQKARLDVFERDIETLRAQLETMPNKETRMSQMDSEIALLKSRLENLMEKSDGARVNERTSSRTNVYLIVPATLATPTRTRDYVRLALAPAFSLVVGIGLAFFLDGLDVTVRTSGHAEEAAELPVLTSVTERRRVIGRW